MAKTTSYVLGHSDDEHRRLMIQARLMRPWTEQYLRAAGVRDGMSVLDIGSGLGDVSLVVAGIVGSHGHVLGVERDAATAAKAAARAVAEGCDDLVDFEVADLATFETERRFDALVGRYVLQYQADPGATLRRLSRLVRPGGVIVFHDMDFSNEAPSNPPCPLWDECYALPTLLFRATGNIPDFGRHLVRTFRDAGLPWPRVEAGVPIAGTPGAGLYAWLASVVQAIAPQLEKAGIPLPEGVVLDDSLSRVLEDAVIAAGSQVFGPPQYGAWTTRPLD